MGKVINLRQRELDDMVNDVASVLEEKSETKTIDFQRHQEKEKNKKLNAKILKWKRPDNL